MASAKRKIGGHFGSAVSASTSGGKRRTAAWRDEVEPQPDAPGAKPPTSVLDGASDSEEPMLDPGTPLPSEEEMEADAPAAAKANGHAPPDPGANGASSAMADAPVAEAANGGDSEKALATALNGSELGGERTNGAVVTLELVVAGHVRGSMRALLWRGLDAPARHRLQACAAADGAATDRLAASAVCEFAGHAATVAAGRDASDACAASEPSSRQHDAAGLLTAPRAAADGGSDLGLALTLGPQPRLDATHEVLGPLLVGRGVVRRLQALAPLSGESQLPRVPVAFRAPKDVDEGVEPAPASLSADVSPFSWEDALSPDGLLAPVEEIEIAELELDGRDAEIDALKQMAFSRERQNGVAAVKESLETLKARLERLGGELEEDLKGRQTWQQERARHLLRILDKLT